MSAAVDHTSMVSYVGQAGVNKTAYITRRWPSCPIKNAGHRVRCRRTKHLTVERTANSLHYGIHISCRFTVAAALILICERRTHLLSMPLHPWKLVESEYSAACRYTSIHIICRKVLGISHTGGKSIRQSRKSLVCIVDILLHSLLCEHSVVIVLGHRSSLCVDELGAGGNEKVTYCSSLGWDVA